MSAPAAGVSVIAVLRSRGRNYWLRAVMWTLVTATAIAVPTRLVPNDLFRRMTPTRPLDYGFWIVGSILIGLVLAFGRSRRTEASGIVGGTVTLFAVGCPVCNKLVVALIGVAGAVDLFAPLQPVLGVQLLSGSCCGPCGGALGWPPAMCAGYPRPGYDDAGVAVTAEPSAQLGQ